MFFNKLFKLFIFFILFDNECAKCIANCNKSNTNISKNRTPHSNNFATAINRHSFTCKTINSSPTTKAFGSTLTTSPYFGHCNNLASNQEVLILISCFVDSQILQKLANLIKQHNSNRFAKILKRESAYEIKKRCFCKHLKSFESYSPNFRQFFQTS